MRGPQRHSAIQCKIGIASVMLRCLPSEEETSGATTVGAVCVLAYQWAGAKQAKPAKFQELKQRVLRLLKQPAPHPARQAISLLPFVLDFFAVYVNFSVVFS